ncbi:hypothetical protein [Roseateles noduli]|uniref:hypothetical protein n=1 Tax=Roseateles noduli TaxID=2052484 RepID=UPI003D646A6A
MNRPSAVRLPLPRPAALCVALLLAGCASPTGQWLRDGASPTDVHRELFDCEREAARMYPPSITSTPAYAGPVAERTTCTKKGDTLDCSTTTPQVFSPRVIDANEGNRYRAEGSCMRGKGFFWREDR